MASLKRPTGTKAGKSPTMRTRYAPGGVPAGTARFTLVPGNRNAWPLALLAAPFVYAIPALTRPLGAALSLGFLVWVGYAVSLLLRRQRADIPRAGVAGFALTLALQRFVRGT